MSAAGQSSSARTRVALMFAAIGLAIALGSGATAAFMAVRPQSLSGSATLTTVPVTKHDFDDARGVQVSVSRGQVVRGVSNVGGHVTSYACALGQPIGSGTSFASIDGVPLLALSTTVPLWRDLMLDARGSDVKALQVELQELGYSVSSDGIYGMNTARAVGRLFLTIDGPGSGTHDSAQAGLPLARVLWIPARSVTAARCDSQLGARVNSGDTLFTTASDTVVQVDDMPKNLVPGARVFSTGGIQAPVDADGTISDPASVAALSDAAQRSINDSSSGGSTSEDDNSQSVKKVSGQIALATPRTTSAVPPSAIVGIDGNRGCVVSGGRAVHVSIVGSQLGQTFVDFASTAAEPRTVEASPSASTPCG